jgi:hypothetical protein
MGGCAQANAREPPVTRPAAKRRIPLTVGGARGAGSRDLGRRPHRGTGRPGPRRCGRRHVGSPSRSRTGPWAVRPTERAAGRGGRQTRRPCGNGRERGCAAGHRTPCARGLTAVWSCITSTADQPAPAAPQRTAPPPRQRRRGLVRSPTTSWTGRPVMGGGSARRRGVVSLARHLRAHAAAEGGPRGGSGRCRPWSGWLWTPGPRRGRPRPPTGGDPRARPLRPANRA